MASQTPSEPPFRDLSTSAALSLARLAEQISKDSRNGTLVVEDAIGRFQLWVGNIGAVQFNNSPKSLDYRLRDAPHIRNTVRVGLERLRAASERASGILAGDLPNRVNSSDGSEDSGTMEPDADELHELLESIKSSITALFRLSMIVRRHRPRGRYPGNETGPDDTPPSNDPLDTRHVCDLFPHVKNRPWLAARLGRAISKRRDYIRSREEHRKSLAKASVSDHCAIPDSGTVATTFVGGKVTENVQGKAYSVMTAATSFLSIGDDGQAIGEAIPDLSDMELEGVQLEYGEPFECPFCRTIQQVSDRREWKKHVFFDLQPYVCTFENCTFSLFESRHEWWQHEMDAHRRKWTCTLCPPSRTLSGSKQQIEKHLRSRHLDRLTERQIPFVLGTCRDPADVDAATCPLCPNWPPDEEGGKGAMEKELARHLARHMQQLSLASIPVHIDGLKIRQAEVGDAGPWDTSWSEELESTSPSISAPSGLGRLPATNDTTDGTAATESRGSRFISSAAESTRKLFSRNKPGTDKEADPEVMDPFYHDFLNEGMETELKADPIRNSATIGRRTTTTTTTGYIKPDENKQLPEQIRMASSKLIPVDGGDIDFTEGIPREAGVRRQFSFNNVFRRQQGQYRPNISPPEQLEAPERGSVAKDHSQLPPPNRYSAGQQHYNIQQHASTSIEQQQQSDIPAAIQRVSSYPDPDPRQPIRLQPSPAYYPPPAAAVPDFDPLDRSGPSPSRSGEEPVRRTNREFIRNLEERTLEEMFFPSGGPDSPQNRGDSGR